MKFFSGYKHVLAETIVFQTSIYPEKDTGTELIQLTTKGLLTVCKWYPWDGASGPVIDRASNYEASCAHDALYELMRKGRIPHCYWELCDLEYIRLLEEHGAWRITMWIDAKGLAFAKGAAAHPRKRKKVHDTLDKRRKL